MTPSLRGRRTRDLLAALLIALGALGLPAAAAQAGRAREAPSAGIAVTLAAPASGTVVPYYGPSPLFRWSLTFADPGQRGSVWLEVSSTRDFRQVARRIFPCGYDPGPCRTAYRFGNHQPYWYDLSDRCADLPPLGGCHGLTGVFYWRVLFEPEGTSRKISSAVGVIRRAGTADHRPPTVRALAGKAAYGAHARFFFYAWDTSGVVRPEFELYRGSSMVYGARTDWDRSGDRVERYVDLILPESVRPGGYRMCVTAYDYSGNRASRCAAYTITG